MISPSIKIKNKNAIQNYIDEINYLKSSKAEKETKNEFKEYLIERIQENFDKSQEADGTRWAALRYRKGKPLILTTALMNSIKAKNTNKGVSVYTNIFYAGWQNYGTEKIPSRRFIPNANEVPEKWYNDFKQIILNNFIRKNGKR